MLVGYIGDPDIVGLAAELRHRELPKSAPPFIIEQFGENVSIMCPALVSFAFAVNENAN